MPTEKRYFLQFKDEAEKLKFSDAFHNAAMANWLAPFQSYFADGALIGFVLIFDAYVDFFNRPDKFPDLKFMEALKLEPSWGDDY